jgi:hypothetical protein
MTEKYLKLLLGAAEIVLGCLGFDSTLYGKGQDNYNGRKWWLEFEEQRTKDIENESVP